MSKRKAATVAQKAKATERRRLMRELARRVSQMSEAERVELVGEGWPVTIEGHRLSMINACMVATQRAGVSIVGGFRQWRTAGRTVCKGEHGQAIWVPLGEGKVEEAEGEGKGEDGEKPRQRFMLVTVFDISQTQES